MIERQKAIEEKLKEYQAAVSKTLDVFGKENYGQMITQWNFTSLRQVLDGAFGEFMQKLMPIIAEYEEALKPPKEPKKPEKLKGE